MFTRRERLSRADLSSAAVLHGRRISSAHFSIVIPGQDIRGFAVIIPKKIARLSVTRHRIKRQVLEALRTLQPLPRAIVVFPKAATSSLSTSEMTQELTGLLSKTAVRP